MKVNYAEFAFKMKFFGLLIAAVLLVSVKGAAQIEYEDLPKTNLNLFQEITRNSLSELEDVVTIIGKEKIYKITVEDNTERKEFFVNELKQMFTKLKFVYEISDSVDYVIKFENLNFRTVYTDLKARKFLGDEYVKRELFVNYDFAVSGKDLSSRKIYKSYKDEIKADKIEYVENGNYAFLKSVLPEKTFLKKIIVPAVIVAVSAIATILFFSIRSK
jgi:hypothetical protein